MHYPFNETTIATALNAEGVHFFDLGHYDCGKDDECGFTIGLLEETAVGSGNWGDFRLALTHNLEEADVYDGRGNTDEDSYGTLLGRTRTAAGAAALIRAALENN